MRLFKALIVLVGLLDAAMFLQSPSSPLSTTTPAQVVGYASNDTATDASALVATASRP